jgi:hypothetical protein
MHETDENLLLRALDLRETFTNNETESDWKQDKDP